jgi:hypothetical protein
VFQDQIADLPHDPPPLRWRHPTPRTVVERASRSSHGTVDVFGAPRSNGRQILPGGPVRRRERLPGGRVDPLTADEESTHRLDIERWPKKESLAAIAVSALDLQQLLLMLDALSQRRQQVSC